MKYIYIGSTESPWLGVVSVSCYRVVSKITEPCSTRKVPCQPWTKETAKSMQMVSLLVQMIIAFHCSQRQIIGHIIRTIVSMVELPGQLREMRSYRDRVTSLPVHITWYPETQYVLTNSMWIFSARKTWTYDFVRREEIS